MNASQLQSIVERIERLELEKSEIAEEIKEVYSEASGNGFQSKIIRKIIAIRKKTPDELSEEEMLIQTYMEALEEK